MTHRIHVKNKSYAVPIYTPLSQVLWLEQGRLIDEDTESQPAAREGATPPGKPKGGGGADE